MISYFCRQLQTSPTTTATASTESPTTSITTTMEDTFATGRYSKRKRTQVNYCMSELDVSDDEDASEFVQVKVGCTLAIEKLALTLHRSAKL